MLMLGQIECKDLRSIGFSANGPKKWAVFSSEKLIRLLCLLEKLQAQTLHAGHRAVGNHRADAILCAVLQYIGPVHWSLIMVP